VLECARKGELLSISLANEIHRLLMDRLTYDAGAFKKHENAILGSDLVTAPVSQVPMLMQQWIDNVEYQLEQAGSDDEGIEVIVKSHMEFEKIHPYSDGNGRTGRMLMNFLLLRTSNWPLIIKGQDRTTYINFLASDDLVGFVRCAKALLIAEKDRGERFLNKEKYQV